MNKYDDEQPLTYVPAPTRQDWIACAVVLAIALPLAIALGMAVAG